MTARNIFHPPQSEFRRRPWTGVTTRMRTWNKPFVFICSAAAVITVSSYIRWAVTGSVKVDGNYPKGPALVLNIILFLVSLAVAGYAYVKVVLRRDGWDLDLGQVKKLAVITAIIAVFMMPMLSNDVFSRLAYGDMLTKGMNPYSRPELLKDSIYAPLIGACWAKAPCVYGPMTVLIDSAAALAGRHSLAAALAVLDIFQLVFMLLFILSAWRYFADEEAARKDAGLPSPAFNKAALVMLAPLVWLMGLGQDHNDIIAGAFLMLALLLMRRGKFTAASLPLIMAVQTKLYVIIAIPLFLILAWSALKPEWKKLAAVLGKSLAIAAAVTVILYAPFHDGGRELTVPSEFLQHKSSAKSITRVISTAIVTMGDVLHIGNSRTEEPRPVRARRVEAPMFPIIKAFSLMLMLLVFSRIRYCRDPEDFIEIFAVLGAVLVCFFSSVFNPWYLAGLVPLFVGVKRPVWALWTALMFASVGAMNVMEIGGFQNLAVRGVADVFIAWTNILFFWRFRSRFLKWPRVPRTAG